MALLGLVSDTHDEFPYIERCVELFRREKCTWVLHCGDIQSAEALRRFGTLTERGAKVVWIPGEHDQPALDQIRRASNEIGATAIQQGPPGTVVEGIKIVLIHNPYGGKGQRRPFLLTKLSTPPSDGTSPWDLVLYGHFHHFNVKYPSIASRTAVVCPGACREDVSPQTVATFDTVKRVLRVYNLTDPSRTPLVAFSTVLSSEPSYRDLRSGRGLDDQFRANVLKNLRDPRRDYWRINDRWGQAWQGDWLDPMTVVGSAR